MKLAAASNNIGEAELHRGRCRISDFLFGDFESRFVDFALCNVWHADEETGVVVSVTGPHVVAAKATGPEAIGLQRKKNNKKNNDEDDEMEPPESLEMILNTSSPFRRWW